MNLLVKIVIFWLVLNAVILYCVARYSKAVHNEYMPRSTKCDNCMMKGRYFKHCEKYRRHIRWMRILDKIVPWQLNGNPNCQSYSEVFKYGKTH